MEPFQHQRQIQKYRRRLGMPYANFNCKGKIWFFVQDNVDVEVLLDIEQSITVKLKFQELNRDIVLEVEHLSRTGSEHAPLLVSCGDQVENFIKPFRFLKFWVEHDTFLDFIKQQWEAHLSDDVFLSFKLKMKKLKVALSTWSKATFGDIFKQLVIREDIVKIKEHLFEETPSEENRMVMQKAQAELKLYLHYEEEFWRQKAGMDCFSEGDKNTRYFHSLVKGRRKRIQIKRIQDATGNWLKDADRVAGKVVNFFHKQFTHEEVSKDSQILNHIPKLIREEDNMLLAEQPTMEEVQKAVFELNEDSTCGLDGFSGIFYQKCWEVMKKMGFFGAFIDLIWRLLANNWYSVLLNGQAHSFFHSTRGVKQGDPLSPALFIIAAEVLSRALNSLFDQPDDTIIFSATDNYSLQMIMDTLQEYEKISGQLINKRKSSFYMFNKVSNELSQQVAAVTGFVRGQFPFTYLGVPITHARKRKVDYTELLKKVKDKLQTWKGKLLSYGRKAVLITSVLQSIPIHVLSAIRPPKCVIKELYRIFARFFWNYKEEGRCRHWSYWFNMCLPKHEGGLGFRSIYGMSKALCAKLCWKFRTTSSLWANFMWNKYCKKQIPQVVQWKGGSQVWKMMLETRESIEQEIWWELKIGSSNIWFDNWTKLGALSYVVPQSWQINDHAEDVSELIKMEDGILTNSCSYFLKM
ncbi:uncharacterized protein LOC132637772 [Lycium barbarum]|uniref:uncharacterized protein LOC132637772 n=1 Tax=Lycium barbarum TaxID=112863 RepID=UPI00293EBBBE|nr:uncharacterized protein LOC132637772 [Lycium barbarum]